MALVIRVAQEQVRQIQSSYAPPSANSSARRSYSYDASINGRSDAGWGQKRHV
jgi:hypothetical protein